LYKRNEWVQLKKDLLVFDAMIKEVTETGELKVESELHQSFTFGEVEWILERS
jgi:hypothetical protein